LVRYDGTALKGDGEYCLAGGTGCTTSVVVFDGTGVRQYSEAVPFGGQCSAVSAVDYDGTAARVLSLGPAGCTAG